jgi:hypothetical protein
MCVADIGNRPHDLAHFKSSDHDSSIYVNDAVALRSSLDNSCNGNGAGAYVNRSMSNAQDRTILSPVYENDVTLVLSDSTTTVRADRFRSVVRPRSQQGSHDDTLLSDSIAAAAESALLSFHTAPDRSLMTTSFLFRSPPPAPNFDTFCSEAAADGGTADWDDRLSTLSLGCRKRKNRQTDAAPEQTGNEPTDDDRNRMCRREESTCGTGFGQTIGHYVAPGAHAGGQLQQQQQQQQQRRFRSRRRRLLFGARMSPEDRTVESVDADVEPIDREFVERHMRRPITNRTLSCELSKSWQATAAWLQATVDGMKQVPDQSDENIYESIGDLATVVQIPTGKPQVANFSNHVYSNVNCITSAMPSQRVVRPPDRSSSPPPLPPPPIPARPRTGRSVTLTPSASLPSLYELPLCPTEIVDLDSDHVYTIADVLASFRALAAHLPRAERFVTELQASARASAVFGQRYSGGGGRRDAADEADGEREHTYVSARQTHRPRHVKMMDADRARRHNAAANARTTEESAAAYVRSRSADCSGVNGSSRGVSPTSPRSSSKETATVGRRGSREKHPAVGVDGEAAATSSSGFDGRCAPCRRSMRSVASVPLPPPPPRTGVSQTNVVAKMEEANDERRRRWVGDVIAVTSTDTPLVCSPGNRPAKSRQDAVSRCIAEEKSDGAYMLMRPGWRNPQVANGTTEHPVSDANRQRQDRESKYHKPGRVQKKDGEQMENKENSDGVSSAANDSRLGNGLFIRRTMASSSLRGSKKYRKLRDANRLNLSAISRSGSEAAIDPDSTSGLSDCLRRPDKMTAETDITVDASNPHNRKPFQTLPVNVGRQTVATAGRQLQPAGKYSTSGKMPFSELANDEAETAASRKSFAVDIAARSATFVDVVNDVRKLNTSGSGAAPGDHQAANSCHSSAINCGQRKEKFTHTTAATKSAAAQLGATVPGYRGQVTSSADVEISIDEPEISRTNPLVRSTTTVSTRHVTQNDVEHRSEARTKIDAGRETKNVRSSVQIRWANGASSDREIFC